MTGAAAPARIHLLADTLANQIAAGEVVERPASVLKELVENALDADASRVEIDIRAGGAALVRVRDDGTGIHPDDLVLALDRHATSKIRTFEDLLAVRTMGFRGEALPSIASVSRLDIASRAAGAETGWRLRVHGGEPRSAPEPCAHPVGTTVAVHDLFFNTPARRKFMRTERTETRHLDEVARRAALVRPDVAMTLRHDERTVWRLAAAGTDEARLRRLATLCGRGFVESAIPVDVAATGLRLHGWLGAPGTDRATADLQHFFVNERAVVDPVARHAVRQALAAGTDEGRHPAYVLFLEIEPEQVDVNVHPAKSEVRHREARLVHDFVRRALTEVLAGERPADAGSVTIAHPGLAAGGPGHGRVAEALSAYARLHAGSHAPGGTLVVAGRFLAAAAESGLALVDLDRARRTWLRARWRDHPDVETTPRPLLVPVAREVDEASAERVEALSTALAELGIDLRRTAPGSVSLRRVPVLLERVDPDALLAAVLRVGDQAAAAGLLEGLLGAIDLAGSWRDEAEDTARLLAALDAFPAGEGARRVLRAEEVARLIGESR